MEKVDIKSMDITELQELLRELGAETSCEAAFRLAARKAGGQLCRNDESFQEPAGKAWRNGSNQRRGNRAAAGFAD